MCRVNHHVGFNETGVCCCRVEFNRVAVIMSLFVAEFINVCKVRRVIVANVISDSVVVRWSYAQRKEICRVTACISRTYLHCVEVCSIRFENLISRPRMTQFRTCIVLSLPCERIVVAHEKTFVKIVVRVHAQRQLID